MRLTVLSVFPLLLHGAGAGVDAQIDTTRTFDLDVLTVIAHRTPVAVRYSAASTSVIDREMIRRLGASTLPEVLDYLPGVLFVHRDGAGTLPMVIARGFFGGGETDYAILLIDGVPATEGRTGAVEWTQMPAAFIDRIEVLRGPGSAMYGDAALGAVINVVTRVSGRTNGAATDVTVASWDVIGAQLRALHSTGAGSLRGFADVERAGGYREHSRALRLHGRVEHQWEAPGERSIHVRLSGSRLENDEPGPLGETALAADPRSAHPSFGDDERTRDALEATAGIVRAVLGPGRLSADARVRRVEQYRVRTLLVTPSLGDTQAHEEREWSLWTRAQFAMRSRRTTLVSGLEAAGTSYTSSYTDPVDDGTVLAAASGRRDTWAAYAEAEHIAGSRLRIYAGMRFDWIRSRGRGRTHDSSWSPRLGVNIEYRRSQTSSGNAYLHVTRSFKAPTLDQLYDEREIRAGDITFNLSNRGLRPQRAVGMEGGVLQKLSVGRNLDIEASLALYLLELKDEIDLDLTTFRYGNIQRSRHRGFELSLAAQLRNAIDIRHALTAMRVEFASGNYVGNRLKNIPGLAAQTTVSVPIASTGRFTLGHRWTGHTYLDDANLEQLEAPAQLDATLAWARDGLSVSLRASNLLNERGAGIGSLLPDPATGTQERLLYPVAGRAFRLTVSIGGLR